MKPIDDDEVHGVAESGKGRNRHSEQVPDEKARHGSLFGHIPGEGPECIGDFKTRQKAEEVPARLPGRRAAQGSLPPDPEGRNDRHSAWAATALAAFIDATGTDEEDAVCDLLVNLMHFCDRHGYDFAAELARGQVHYDAETGRTDP